MRWNLSSKIVVAYLGLTTVTVSALSTPLYWQLRTSQRQALQDRLLGTVSLAARQINSHYHALINQPQDINTAYYTINQQKLQEIQASDPDIIHLYTLRFQAGHYTVVLDYVPDTQKTRTQIGDFLQDLPPSLQKDTDIQAPTTELVISTNQDGHSVLYGYAPIKSSLGQADEILVIEMDASSVIEREARAFMIVGWMFLVVLLISLPIVWWLRQSLVVKLILRFNQITQRLADGQWDETLPTNLTDELGPLANAFNHMTLQLQVSFQQLQDYSQSFK